MLIFFYKTMLFYWLIVIICGFYDGDISKLAGIDITTGQVSDETSITGEKENKDTTLNKKDIVEELETLTKLFESGALNKEEFEEAKKKLLNN